MTPFPIPFPSSSSYPITLLISREDDDGRRRVFARRDNLNVCMYVWRVHASARGEFEMGEGRIAKRVVTKGGEREREKAIPRDSIESDDIRA